MNHYGYCWNRPLDLVDLNGMWPSWSDIGNGIKDAASSVIDTVSTTVSNAADAVGNFYEEHKEVIDSTLKIAGTVAAIAAVGVTSVMTGGVAGAILASAAVGASVGAVSGGVSNAITGGSFANGFVGGAVNGGIVGTAIAIPGAGPGMGYFANGIGGFTGNMITEHLNNGDGANKSSAEILGTSIATGIGQAFLGGGCNHLGIANGINTAANGGMSYNIWQGFSNAIGFSGGGSVYIISDYTARHAGKECPSKK